MRRVLIAIAWVGSFVSLTGAIFVANHSKAGWILYLIAIALLMPIQVYNRTWPQVFMMTAYSIVNFYALFH